MQNKQEELINAIKTLTIPEVNQRALFEDYLEFLKIQNVEQYNKILKRLEKESDFFEKCLLHCKTCMIATTLLMSLDKSVDFELIVKKCFASACFDDDIIKMKNELTSRAMSMNKDLPGLSGINKSLLNRRKTIFLEL